MCVIFHKKARGRAWCTSGLCSQILDLSHPHCKRCRAVANRGCKRCKDAYASSRSSGGRRDARERDARDTP